MTLLPHENWNVVGVDDAAVFPRYQVGPHCAAPGCHAFADHAHHIWRRSFLRGDYAWVRLWDDRVIGNLTGLCWRHHDDVTGTEGGHRARIVFDGKQFLWATHLVDQDFMPIGPLDPQPPLGALPATAVLDTARTDESSGQSAERDEVCPTCGHVKRPKIELPPGERRKRKTWNVKVPDDDEDGADVLDSLIDAISERIGTSHYTSALARYHTLVPVLWWASQHIEELVAELKEAAEA